MKLKISLIGLFMASMEVVAGITTSKTIPISTTKSINTTKITSKSSLSSKTIPTSTSVKAIPTVTQLDPNDFWYYGDDIYHKVLDSGCGLDSNNHRSLEAYKECMDQYEIYYKGYLKSYYEEKIKIITNSSSVGSKSTKTVSSSYDGGSKSTCPTKGGWVGMYMSNAIKNCNSKQAAVRHYGSCIGNSPYYYCDLMHTKTLNEMKIIPYTNPTYVYRKRDLSNNNDNNISSSTKTIPTLSSTKTIPTQNLNLNSSKRICDDNSDSSYHCCRNDQPVSVALVDSSGVWGIQLFGDKYDWCFYEDVKPVVTYTITSTITTKILPVSTSASTTTTTKIPPVITSASTTTTTTTKIPPVSISSSTTTTTKIPPVSISSSTTTTTKIPPVSISSSTTTTTKIPPVSISSSTTTTTKIPPVSISSSTTTTTTTKIPPVITSTSSSCIPKTLTVTLTERETVTKKEYVTVTVTDHSAGETTPSEKCSGKWAQCGGVGFNGPTCCESGSTCHKINEYYSQCI